MENKLLETIKSSEKEFVEKGADLEHDRWAKWQEYLHSLCIDASGSGIKHCIPQDSYNHWEKQIKTNYKDLSEQEKESDRKEVRKYMWLLKKSRIKELEVLVKILKKKEKTWGGYDGEEIVDDKQSLGYNEALDDVIKVLKDTIKKLK